MKILQKLRTLLAKPITPLWLCVFIDILGYSMLTPFLPQVMLDMDIPVAMTGLFLSIPPLIGFFTNIIWGSLSDKIGRKPVILILRIGTMVSYALLAFASNVWMVVLSRVLAGIFNAVVPVSMTMMSDILSEKERSYELSKVGVAWIVGNIIGPTIGALVMGRGAFGIGIVNATLVMITVIVTQALLTETIVVKPENKKANETEGAKPVISVGLMKQPLPRLLLIQSIFNRLPYFMFVMTASLYLTVRFDFSVAQIGTFFTTLSIFNLVIRSLIFPRLLRKLGDDNTVRLGFGLYIIAFGWLIFASQVWEFALINMLLSFATTTAIDVMTGVMSNAVRKDEMGKMLGLSSASESLAMIIGPIIGSNLLALQGNAWYGLFATGLALIPFALDFLPLRRAHKSTLQEE